MLKESVGPKKAKSIIEQKECEGCGEKRPAGEMKSLEGVDLCERCQRMEQKSKQFARLEEEEGRISDEIMELESDLNWAQERVDEIKARITEARKRYGENELRMTNFDWTID
ncbi:hypothetical protein [Paenibacillus phage Pd_22F]|nr:hypothetical protein [Paenibacillus phage Pd_22F]